MQLIEAIVRPHTIHQVKTALYEIGVKGLTVSDVRGAGQQKGQVERFRGSEYTADFINKAKIEVAVDDDQVEVVVETIIKAARTGEIGDGKIFIRPLTDVVRIRTGVRGSEAI